MNRLGRLEHRILVLDLTKVKTTNRFLDVLFDLFALVRISIRLDAIITIRIVASIPRATIRLSHGGLGRHNGPIGLYHDSFLLLDSLRLTE